MWMETVGYTAVPGRADPGADRFDLTDPAVRESLLGLFDNGARFTVGGREGNGFVEVGLGIHARYRPEEREPHDAARDRATAWPSPDLERLAASAEELAERLAEPELRAQAFGLAAVIRRPRPRAEAGRSARWPRTTCERVRAVGLGDEAVRLDGAPPSRGSTVEAVLPVDWSKVTGG